MTEKIAFTKNGAIKMIDPDDKNQVAILVAAGWVTEEDKPAAKRGRPAKGE